MGGGPFPSNSQVKAAQLSKTLLSFRSSSGAIVARPEEICSSGKLAPSTCPALDGSTCIFPFQDPDTGSSYFSCQSKNDDFWCQTDRFWWSGPGVSGSEGVSTCDKTKCPLHGSQEAPSQAAQRTGSS